MSDPLCMIGAAVFERIGLNPTGFKRVQQATLAEHQVFDDVPFYQPTAMGSRKITVELATRPHIFGGLQNIAILRAQQKALAIVPFMRLYGVQTGLVFPVGQFDGDVFIDEISETESKLAPDGIGYRHEFTVELTLVGARAGGF